jgi:predicted metalloendopeptidase
MKYYYIFIIYLLGKKYNETGQEENWFSDESLKKLQEREECMIKQYESEYVSINELLNVWKSVMFTWKISLNNIAAPLY